MGFLSAVIGVVFLIYLLLRISRMVGGTTTTTVTHETYDERPELPNRSEAEIQSLLSNMPTKWVTYQGMTPPLELKIRGMTEELYRRFMRNYFDAYGQHNLDRLPAHEKMEIMKTMLPDINARAYVVDWSSAQYPNGNPLPFTPDNLAALIRKDELLRNFISDESAKLDVPW